MNLLAIRATHVLGATVSALALAVVSLVGAPPASADAVTPSNETYTTYVNQTLVVAAPGVLAHVTSSGGTLTAGLQTPPSRGTLILNADGSFRYTPALNFVGSETFQYYAIDGLGGRAVGTVTMNVTRLSLAALADVYTVGTGLYLNVAPPGVLANDSDPSGGQLAVVSVTQPTNGSVVLYTNGAFTYISNPGFVGVDTFSYEVSNGTDRATGPVEITVTASGDGSPVAADPPAGASASSGSSAALPAATGAGSSGSSGAGSGAGSGTGSGGATTPDIALTVVKKRTKPKVWVVTATATNVGAGAANAPALNAVLAKGVTWSKVKAPTGWTCTKKKATSACTLAGSLAPGATATVTYTVKTTPGNKRTVKLTSVVAGDTVAANDSTSVKVPAK